MRALTPAEVGERPAPPPPRDSTLTREIPAVCVATNTPLRRCRARGPAPRRTTSPQRRPPHATQQLRLPALTEAETLQHPAGALVALLALGQQAGEGVPV